ncbi:MAG: hypothetical protein M3R59_02790 [Verrucomicrobiota bacterium]|nr:hypothetical protein [Verrucomicrobiota bacterium]
MRHLLQILPTAPGPCDGVADYALNAARGLRAHYGIETTFAVHQPTSASAIDAFPIVSLHDSSAKRGDWESRVLHYVNYGFERRGIPFWLPSFLRNNDMPLLTIFHELFASGPPWRSEFWLRPFQKKIAREIALLSCARLVSSETMARLLSDLVGLAPVAIRPVPSTLGEPKFSSDELSQRDPKAWAIFGGTQSIERSFSSFAKIFPRLPAAIRPATLEVLGGVENASLRARLSALSNIRAQYHPRVSVEEGSRLLSRCAFLWLDYFGGRAVPGDVILKSSAFASACAHGVVPIFAQKISAITHNGARFPGPFYVDAEAMKLPDADANDAVYQWYQTHATISGLAETIAHALVAPSMETNH